MFIYGPVPSWRFGFSLGVDLIGNVKTCSFNCIYCQLGRTVRFLYQPKFLDGMPTPDDIEHQLKEYLRKIDASSVNVVTFSGEGEPTLNPHIRSICETVRKIIGRKFPIVLLTNSSTIYIDEVFESLKLFDIICFKLDAIDDKLFRAINRPYSKVPSISTIINRMKEFRESYTGKLAIQIMLLETTFSKMNSSPDYINLFVKALDPIAPDIIQVSTPYRPPAEKYVKPVSYETLRMVNDIFSHHFRKESVWVYGIHKEELGKPILESSAKLEEFILEILRRRPCTLQDICNVTGRNRDEVIAVLNKLLTRKLVIKVKVKDKFFYRTLTSRKE